MILWPPVLNEDREVLGRRLTRDFVVGFLKRWTCSTGSCSGLSQQHISTLNKIIHPGHKDSRVDS